MVRYSRTGDDVPEREAPSEDPQGFLVTVGEIDRIHFLDWSLPAVASADHRAPVLLIHGLAGTAWSWAPIARRLPDRRVVAQDLRGHGLSDAPTSGYTPGGLADDALAVAEGAGLLEPGAVPLVVAGHGFGAIVAAGLAGRLGPSCGGLVLVDGGWEEAEDSTGLEPEELLRSLDEPPEVLRSMAAFLADRAGFDPATWDEDQERAARASVVELPAGRVVPVTRPHVLAACVDTMYAYRPSDVLAAVEAPILALVGAESPETMTTAGDTVGTIGATEASIGLSAGSRRKALARLDAGLRRAGRAGIRAIDLPDVGHNLMRYRPDAVAWAIETVGSARPAYHPGS